MVNNSCVALSSFCALTRSVKEYPGYFFWLGAVVIGILEKHKIELGRRRKKGCSSMNSKSEPTTQKRYRRARRRLLFLGEKDEPE